MTQTVSSTLISGAEQKVGKILDRPGEVEHGAILSSIQLFLSHAKRRYRRLCADGVRDEMRKTGSPVATDPRRRQQAAVRATVTFRFIVTVPTAYKPIIACQSRQGSRACAGVAHVPVAPAPAAKTAAT